MRFTYLRIRLLPVLLAMVLSGCHIFETPNWSLHEQVENSPLTPPRIAHDSVVIAVTFVRVPVEVNESNDAVWQDIDETHLSPQ